jgi:hypothetical protein
MSLLHLCQWLSATPAATAMRESPWIYSLIESIHVLGITALAGTAAVLDLRLLGFTMRREQVSQVVELITPIAWFGAAIMFGSGLLLFWAKAENCYANPAFRLKLLLLLLLLAASNPLVFHLTTYRSVASWENATEPPPRAKVAGILSLVLWSGIIVAGRAIAYYH